VDIGRTAPLSVEVVRRSWSAPLISISRVWGTPSLFLVKLDFLAAAGEAAIYPDRSAVGKNGAVAVTPFTPLTAPAKTKYEESVS
jgi:hypothetical protein